MYSVYEGTEGVFEPFLIADSAFNDVNRILIFSRASVGGRLGFTEKIYVDGTFSLSPKLFSQILVILAERSGFVVPLCYALLPDKAGKGYEKMLELLCNAWPQLKPAKVSLDYEIGPINAFRKRFPNAEMNGCLFHLVKNLKSKLREQGLLNRYNDDADLNSSPRMVPDLAFVPKENLSQAITELTPELPAEHMPVFNYFEDNYVGHSRMVPGGGIVRHPARFPIATWSVYQRTLYGASRTNNFAEAVHRKLQGEFGVDYPTLWRFVDGFREVQHSRDVVYARYVLAPRRRLFARTEPEKR